MKLLVLAFDGMGYESLVEPYIDSVMPFYKRLRDGGGVYGGYESVYRMTFPSWMSIYTGVKREKHMVTQGINSLLTRPLIKTYWETLGEQGLVQGMFHMPLTYPPTRLNGWMVSGFPSPTENVALPDMVYCFPAKLEGFLKGYYRTIDDWDFSREGDGYERSFSILRAVKAAEQENLRVLDRVLGWKQVDCLSVGFQFPDFINHSFGPRETDEDWRREKIVKRHLCRLIDQLTTKIVNKYKPERFLVCADHGFYEGPTAPEWSQAHAADGSLFIGGEGVKNRMVPKGVHEWDLFPLILKLCDVEVPKHRNGKGFPIFEREISQEEEASITKRLRALGYDV